VSDFHTKLDKQTPRLAQEDGRVAGRENLAYIAASVRTQIITTYTHRMSRSQRSQQPFPPVVRSIFHTAASKQIARAQGSASTSPTPSSSSSTASHGYHKLPTGDYTVVGVDFEVDFEHVYRRGERLHAARLTYRVRHKSQLKGKRELASSWKYGVELSYLEDDLITSSARRTITDDRNGLSGSKIEALQLQKNWLRRGVVKSPIKDLAKHVENLTKTSNFGSIDSTLNSSFSSTDSQIGTPGQS